MWNHRAIWKRSSTAFVTRRTEPTASACTRRRGPRAEAARAFLALALTIGPASVAASDDCDDACRASDALGQLIALDILQGELFEDVAMDAERVAGGLVNRMLPVSPTVDAGAGAADPDETVPRERLVAIVREHIRAARMPASSRIRADLSDLDCADGKGGEPLADADDTSGYAIRAIGDDDWRTVAISTISRDTGLSWGTGSGTGRQPDEARAVTIVYRELTIGAGDDAARTATIVCGDEPLLVSYGPWQLRRFPMDGVIEGWRQGIGRMHTGQFARLLVEPAKAYGEQVDGEGRQPKTLVHEIGLHDVH